MLTILNHVGAALLVPALATPAHRPDCQLDRLTYVSADDRAIGRFVAATHDYAAFGKQGAVFNEHAAQIFRFRLRLGRWLHRYDATQTLADVRPASPHAHRAFGAPGVAAAALPELPEELEYRVAGEHLLLVDRRTNAVVDMLADAFDERLGR